MAESFTLLQCVELSLFPTFIRSLTNLTQQGWTVFTNA